MWRSIISAERTSEPGLTLFWPAYLGAVPWVASNLATSWQATSHCRLLFTFQSELLASFDLERSGSSGSGSGEARRGGPPQNALLGVLGQGPPVHGRAGGDLVAVRVDRDEVGVGVPLAAVCCVGGGA